MATWIDFGQYKAREVASFVNSATIQEDVPGTFYVRQRVFQGTPPIIDTAAFGYAEIATYPTFALAEAWVDANVP